ncbi:DUF397 domain-containing protein [Streptomyces sp. TRM66268-LWL]|uniref:DUF397 domain-containing protein n=1 Tax=Streptomyces polyasparticus TaxID=2767826 RepID=A0ABR7SU94_9ACTN|nr:DUF397 domain-containing protein [Streptomyces polyasparticus]MBC9718106.1 DUF397 domain-containing protein [Streptomyces polyasparticus]
MHRSNEYVSIPDASTVPGWRKSSYSGGSSGECLEVSDACQGACVPVRDSKNPTGPAIAFSPATWVTFVTAVRTGTL